jgi:hypothetical protein
VDVKEKVCDVLSRDLLGLFLSESRFQMLPRLQKCVDIIMVEG